MKNNDEKILSALISARTISAAAAAAGVSERTIYARLSDDAFRAEYERRQSMTIDAACKELQAAMTDAAKMLAQAINNERYQLSSRISAARIVLDYGVKLTELTDLTARVAALEEAAKEAGR